MKTPEELITDEFVERLLTEIPCIIQQPKNGFPNEHSHRASYRREMRRLILERLKG